MPEPDLPSNPSNLPTEELQFEWLRQAQAGQLGWSEFAERILASGTQELAGHHPDTDRGRRCGFGEVIFGEGKSAQDIEVIAQHLLESGQREVLVTRIAEPHANELKSRFPQHNHNAVARTLRVALEPPCPAPLSDPSCDPNNNSDTLPRGNFLARVAVVTAGSTDFPVASEALETLAWMGIETTFRSDVGVAGPYRLLRHLEELRSADAVVVVAGMEGALASVVGGLIDSPIIAVPTSVGYGANLAGITTLLSMLSSCAAGVTSVNIDAGFKGAYIAGLIATRVQRAYDKAFARSEDKA